MIVLKAAQANLLEALQSVAGIVERRHTLPILANVLIEAEGVLRLLRADRNDATALAPAPTTIPLADAVDNGQLAAITLRPVGNLAMAWLLLRGAFGQLGEADNVVSCSFRSMTVRRLHLFSGRGIKVATDLLR